MVSGNIFMIIPLNKLMNKLKHIINITERAALIKKDNMTEEEYQRMFENVQHVSRLISEGWYARRAVSEIVNASCDRK